MDPVVLAQAARQARANKPIGANRGNNSVTLITGQDAPTQRFDTTLTADRTVALSTAEARNGDTFHIFRTGGGVYELRVGDGPLKALATDTWGIFRFDGAAWNLVAYGSL